MWVQLAVFVALMYAPDHPYGSPQVEVEIENGNRWITVTVPPPPTTGPEYETEVFYTAEPLMVVSAQGHKEVKESDLVGSGLKLDLNGDGDTDDTLPTRCEGKRSVIGESTFTPLLTSSQMVYGDKSVGRIGDKGAHVVQYSRCGPFLAMGFSPANRPITVEKLKGPMLQISVAQPQASPRALPTVTTSNWTMDGKPASPKLTQVKSYEPGPQEKPSWVHVHWGVMTIPVGGAHKIRFRLDGSGKVLIAAAVNVAPEAGRRWRGPMGFLRL